MHNYIEKQLKIIKNKGLYRELKKVNSPQSRVIDLDGKKIINFSSNNYLGLTLSNLIIKSIKETAEKWGTGAGASRLISGNLSLYQKLEEKLAEFKARQSALVYPTGFMANTGIISALTTDKDALIIDRLNHASIIDGTKLSGARRFVYKHCDMNSLEKALKRCAKYDKRVVITDTVFSMDGDIAPLDDITGLCNKYHASLIVDEAHAFGVFGKHGQGIMNEMNLENKALIDMGTFSKSAASLGGYVCTDSIIREYLINTSRSLIYTTGLPPHVISANIAAVDEIINADEKRKHLIEISNYLRSFLNNLGFETADSKTQIIPVIMKGNDIVIKLQKHLYDKYIYAPAIRFPTVPKGSARIRVSLTAEHTKDDINKLISALKEF